MDANGASALALTGCGGERPTRSPHREERTGPGRFRLRSSSAWFARRDAGHRSSGLRKGAAGVRGEPQGPPPAAGATSTLAHRGPVDSISTVAGDCNAVGGVDGRPRAPWRPGRGRLDVTASAARPAICRNTSEIRCETPPSGREAVPTQRGRRRLGRRRWSTPPNRSGGRGRWCRCWVIGRVARARSDVPRCRRRGIGRVGRRGGWLSPSVRSWRRAPPASR